MPAGRGTVYFGGVPATEMTPEMLTALAEALRGRTVEGVWIHDVITERNTGIDLEPWVRVTLLLGDPDPAGGTWSVAVVQALDELARAVAWDLDIPDWLRIMHVAISEAGGIFPAEAIARARAAAA